MRQDLHQKSIIDQFTKQAVPFSRAPAHAQGLDLMMEMAMVTAGDTVLDVACGPGLVACAFAEGAAEVTGVDITPAMIDRARELQRERGVSNVTWKVADVGPLPFADSSFSVVLTRYSFHHFTNPRGVLAEMIRVCKPCGTVMVVDVVVPAEKREAYNRVERLRDPSHTHALTEAELLGMGGDLGLKDVRTQRYELEMELEAILKASFPNPGCEQKIRETFRGDIGKDDLGVAAHWVGDEIHFAFPIMILAGKNTA
jgi:ubiquinone/menaquinone biosynthesis C-methylase UbiE